MSVPIWDPEVMSSSTYILWHQYSCLLFCAGGIIVVGTKSLEKHFLKEMFCFYYDSDDGEKIEQFKGLGLYPFLLSCHGCGH